MTLLVTQEYGRKYYAEVWVPAYQNAGSIDDLPPDVRGVIDEMLRRPNFNDFFFGKLKTARFPVLQDIRDGKFDRYTRCVNVSDIYRPDIDEALSGIGIQTFWFPLGEAFGISLASLYGALRILWEAEKDDQPVLLHCHSGKNRSVMVAECYFFLRTGTHRKSRQSLSGTHSSGPEPQLFLNIDDGQLPGIYKMEEFLSCCGKSFAEDFPEKDRPLDWIKLQMLISGSGFTAS